MWDFLKNHHKIALGLLAVLLLATSFVAGRYSRPAQVKIQEKIVTQVVTKEVAVIQKQTDTTKEIKKAKHYHRETVTVKAPDGTVTTKTVVDNNVNQNTNQNTQQTTNQTVTVDKTATQHVDYSKTVTDRPNFQLSLKLGVDVSNLTVSGSPPYVQPIVLGLEVDKRVFGPVWLGVWGMTNNKFNDFQAGLALTYQP